MFAAMSNPLPNQQQEWTPYAYAPRKLILHNYTDRASRNYKVASSNEYSGAARTLALPFIHKLFHMLSVVEHDNCKHIVSWQPHGRCFVIHQPREFCERLLPCYFGLSKITSFQRQLNLYGFRRLSQGPDKGCYYHELFLRAQPHLLDGVMRTKVKGTGIRLRANPQEEPNFWAMPWVGVPPNKKSRNTMIKKFNSNSNKNLSSPRHARKMHEEQKRQTTPAAAVDFLLCQQEKAGRHVSEDDHSFLEDEEEEQETWKEWGMSFYAMRQLPDGVAPVPSSPEEEEIIGNSAAVSLHKLSFFADSHYDITPSFSSPNKDEEATCDAGFPPLMEQSETGIDENDDLMDQILQLFPSSTTGDEYDS